METGRKICLAVVGLTLTGAMVVMGAQPTSADVEQVEDVDGGASGVDAQIVTPVAPIVVPPTPAVTLPDGGGSASDSLVAAGEPGAVQAGVADVNTAGGGTGTPDGRVRSDASAVGIDAGGGALTADVLASECRADGSGAGASATVADVHGGGNQIADGSPPPNTGGAIPGVGAVTVNQQQVSQSDAGNGARVSALAVDLDNPAAQGSVGVSRSHCFASGGPLAGSDDPAAGGTPGVGAPSSPPTSGSGPTAMLARTGSELRPLAAVGGGLIGLGWILRRLGRPSRVRPA